jgi:hypothetical protein
MACCRGIAHEGKPGKQRKVINGSGQFYSCPGRARLSGENSKISGSALDKKVLNLNVSHNF